jgi:hypothetical protein
MKDAPRTPEDPAEEQPAAEGAEGEASTPAAASAERVMGAVRRELRDWWDLFRECYFSFDRRTLGFTRVLLGFFLLMDLFHRGRVWMDMYSNEGVLPTHVNLDRMEAWRTFSIFNAFSTPGELRVLWALMFVTFFCLFIGYKTKVAQILSLVFISGMNGRVLLVENGGYVVHNLLLLWTCFLPLGDRFSVDAMRASWRRRREASADELNDRSDVLTPEQQTPHVSALGPVLMIQLAAMYFFNVIHKKGPAWKNWTAVHYVLYVDRMVTPIVGLVRDHIPNSMVKFMTATTLGFEAALPFALLQPVARVWSRRIAIVMINVLHLAFGTAMILGPFAWACCTFSTLLFSSEDWELASRSMRREHRARTVVYNPRSASALLVCRILKRLDRFELLTFQEEAKVPLGVGVLGSDSRQVTRSAAFADILAALPLGPSVAWILRARGLRRAFDALFAWLEARDIDRFFGLRLSPSLTLSDPSKVRRGGRRALAAVREVGILVMFAGAINQACVDLWVIKAKFRVPQPEPLWILSQKMRFLQGWFMFSPNPVTDDGTIVVDAITVDGRHLDPFTRQAPAFDISQVKSFGYNQIWCDYYNRMHLPSNATYRDAMRDYMLRLPQRTGHPEDAIVSGDVYWVQDMNPLWNQTASFKPERVKLFSFESSSMKVAPTSRSPPSDRPSRIESQERRSPPIQRTAPIPPREQP